MNVTVIGLGAMGGGMARSILRSHEVNTVSGYDLSSDLVTQFYQDSASAGKTMTSVVPSAPFKLSNFVTNETDVVVIVLVNEQQCNTVCFGGNDNANLISLMKPNGCVFLCSTVTPAFAKSAHEKFANKSIQFVDCPMSGGPVRALAGELNLV